MTVSEQWRNAFVLCPATDLEVVERMAQRAEEAGYAATLVGLKRWAETQPTAEDDEAPLLRSLATKSLEGEAAEASRRAVDERRRLVEEQRRLVEERRRLAEAEERLAAERRRADAEERRRADERAAARRDEALGLVAEPEFWRGTPAKLRASLRHGPRGSYDVELRGDGVDGLEFAVEGGRLRVGGVLAPGPAAAAALLRAVDEHCPRRYRRDAAYRADLLRRVAGGRYGRVDETVDLPRGADLSRAALVDAGDADAVVVRVPGGVAARRPRRAAPPIWRPAGAFGREPSYPPLVGGGGGDW